MKYGDISNLPAPVVIIDAELLLERKRKPGWRGLFQRSELVPYPHSYNILYGLFKQGIDVWVTCMPGSGMRRDAVHKALDQHSLCYSMVFETEESGLNLGVYTRLDWVHGVFYLGDPPNIPFATANKYYPVDTIFDVLSHIKG